MNQDTFMVPAFYNEFEGYYSPPREKTYEEVVNEIRYKISDLRLKLKDLVDLKYLTEEQVTQILAIIMGEQ